MRYKSFPVLVFLLLLLQACGSGGGGGSTPAGTSTPPPIVRTASFVISTISNPTSESGTPTATFTVRLGSQPTDNVTIPVSSSDTTEGTVAITSLTFTNSTWNADQTVTVTGVSDLLADGNVAYNILLGTTSSADALYNGLNPDDVAVTNTDVRTASFVISTISNPTSESGTPTATFTVRLGSQPTANVTIPVTSGDPSEGTVSPASLIFTNANWSTPQNVTVTGVSDNLADGNITYNVVLGPTSSPGDSLYNNLNPGVVAVTNNDIGVPTASCIISAISGSTSESGTTATFTVHLASLPTANVTIPVTSGDLTEGTVSPASLIFTSGINSNYNINQTVTVTGVSDNLADGPITYNIQLGPTISNDTQYNNLTPAAVSVTNTDVRSASFGISPLSGTTNESGGIFTFTVRLGSQPTNDVTIPVSSSDTTEGTVSPASLIFTNANWNTNQTVTVTGVNDNLADGNVAYNIVLGSATSSDSVYSGQNPADVAVTNTDVRSASFVISPLSGTTNESGGIFTFTVRLGSQPTNDVTILVSSSDTTEGTVSPASLIFTNANWNTNQTVTVTGVNDNLADGNVAYNIVLGSATSSDSVYSGQNPADVAVTNTDVRSASFIFGAIIGNTSESGATASFTVRLGSQPTDDVTIPISSSDTTEGTVAIANLIFTNANWNTNQTVTVTGVNDNLADGNVAYTIVLGTTSSNDGLYSGLNPNDVTVTNTDVRSASFVISAISGSTSESGTTATFTVSLGSQPTANVTIPVTSGNLTEGTVSTASLIFTNLNWNSNHTVTVTGVNDFVADSNKTYNVVLGTTSSGDSVYNSLNPGVVAVTNNNIQVNSLIVNWDYSEANFVANYDLRGMNVYVGGTKVCTSPDAGVLAAKTITCNVSSYSLVKPFSFTITAYDGAGEESVMSDAFTIS